MNEKQSIKYVEDHFTGFKDDESPERFMYRLVDGDLVWDVNGHTIRSGTPLGMICVVDNEDNSMRMIKHGELSHLKTILDKYSVLDNKLNQKTVLLDVDFEDYKWINIIVNISASKWLLHYISYKSYSKGQSDE